MTKVVNETTCGSLLISQDRFDVVLEYYDRITDIWNKGHCNGDYKIDILHTSYNNHHTTNS